MAGNNQRPFSLFVLQKGGTPTLLVKEFTKYSIPIPTDGHPHGNSRTWGDASLDVQRKVVTRFVELGQQRGYSDGDIAIGLAIIRRESGFNPDAAAGTTSASGLGQFVNNTAAGLKLAENKRFDIDANINAFFELF